MNPEIQAIGNFIKLINTQPDIFSEQDRNELEAIITPLSNDDVDELADKIDNWCTSHPVIDDALNGLTNPSGRRTPGGAFPTDETKAEEEKNLKETVINALRKSSPPETQKPNTPKG